MMTIDDTSASSRTATPAMAPGWPLVVAAVGFLAFYISNTFVVPALASSALPLPDVPAEELRAWYVENQLAAVTTGVVQLLSVACLGWFAFLFTRAFANTEWAAAARRASGWGFAAVGFMALSSVLGWALAALSVNASVDTVDVLRTGNFVAGGTAHVVLLGIFVLLASRIPGMSRPVRVMGYVAVVPAVLSLSSLFAFEGAAFILIGRLLCMVWVVCAAVSLARAS